MTVSADGLAVWRAVAGPLTANAYVVSRRTDAIVVDPGEALDQLGDRVAELGLQVGAVLATHGHLDHVADAAEAARLWGAPFAIHSADLSILRRVNLYRFALHRQDPVAIPVPDIDLAGRGRLSVGEIAVEVMHTPGHSPGSVCLGVDGQLWTGDTLSADVGESSRLPGFDRRALVASVRSLMRRFSPETVIHPGHGEPGRLADMARRALGALRA